jgi:GNAT superfamily N-acetyltransferase
VVELEIRPPRPDEFTAWAELFGAYRSFYRLDADDSVIERVWSWIHDDAHETNALVAVLQTDPAQGDLVGLAHYRRFARPSTGTTGLWLDDLFTASGHRGAGVGRRIVERLREHAAAQDLSVVRWITARDNVTAQRLYDALATRTSWVTYDLSP